MRMITIISNLFYNNKRYLQFSAYLKNIFKEKVYKITLDAGFNCPNRDGSISNGGCIFCDDSGSFSNAHSSSLTIKEQLQISSKFLSDRFKAKKFISYFQAFSNTYKPLEELKLIYPQALDHKDVVGLSIGTRPDCIDEYKLDYINQLAENNKLIWIEYGLQSIHDKTLNLINRGHDYLCFENAFRLTKERKNINICVHVILGLPGESYDDMILTAKKLAQLNIDGIKIHLLCVLKNTKLEKLYQNNELNLLSENDYVSLVCDFLEYLPPSTTIHRIAGNGYSQSLVAPLWLNHKFQTLNKIDLELLHRNSFQGKKFINP